MRKINEFISIDYSEKWNFNSCLVTQAGAAYSKCVKTLDYMCKDREDYNGYSIGEEFHRDFTQ